MLATLRHPPMCRRRAWHFSRCVVRLLAEFLEGADVSCAHLFPWDRDAQSPLRHSRGLAEKRAAVVRHTGGREGCHRHRADPHKKVSSLDHHTTLVCTPVDPAAKTTKSYFKENSVHFARGAPQYVAAYCLNHAESRCALVR